MISPASINLRSSANNGARSTTLVAPISDSYRRCKVIPGIFILETIVPSDEVRGCEHRASGL